MRLHEFQQGFIESIQTQDASSIFSAQPSCRLAVSDGLSIYAANLSDGLTDVLRATYSSVQKLVGDDFFRMMAKAYTADHLPVTGNMNVYGAEFPKFIETYKAAASLPYLSDVARFDWAWNDSYFAVDDTDLDVSIFSSFTPEDYQRLGIVFKTSVHFLASDYPVDLIWKFCESGGQEGTLNIGSDTAFLMIWRPSIEVQTLRLSKAEYLFLVSMKMGIGMVDSLDHALREDPSFEAQDFIQKFLSLKVVKSIVLPYSGDY